MHHLETQTKEQKNSDQGVNQISKKKKEMKTL